jgi:hypothetical protein
MLVSVSPLDEDGLAAVQALERETGRTLVAFSPLPLVSDEVGDDELARIRDLEARLGVMLVAVRERPRRPRRRRTKDPRPQPL